MQASNYISRKRLVPDSYLSEPSAKRSAHDPNLTATDEMLYGEAVALGPISAPFIPSMTEIPSTERAASSIQSTPVPTLSGHSFFKKKFQDYSIKQLLLDFYEHDLFNSGTWTDNMRERKRCNDVMDSISAYIERVVSSGEVMKYPSLVKNSARRPQDKCICQDDVNLMRMRVTDKNSSEYNNWWYKLVDITTLIAHNYCLELGRVEQEVLAAYNKHKNIVPVKGRDKKDNVSGVDGRLTTLKNIAGFKIHGAVTTDMLPKHLVPPRAITFLSKSSKAAASSSSSAASSSSSYITPHRTSHSDSF